MPTAQYIAEQWALAKLLPPHIRPYREHELSQRYGARELKKVLSPKDAALKEACRWDMRLFASTFLPHWCSESFNQLHLDYYAQYAARAGSRSHLDAIAAPRGHSKTTGCAMVAMVHACCYQTEKYIVYLTNKAEHADERTKDIRDELSDNSTIRRVFGPMESKPWNEAFFRTAGGVYVKAASRGTQVRGLNIRGQRPTRVIIDDIENPDHVVNESQRDKTDAWLKNDILKLGQPSTTFEVFGTILHPESMLNKIMHIPGWNTRLYQAVMSWCDADAQPLWQQWREMYINKGNPKALEDSRAFFAANEQAMLKGAQVLWPERRSYLDLMETRLRDGDSSFYQELQNEPLHDARYLFDMEAAAYCTVHPEGITRAGGTYVPYEDIVEIAAYWDSVPDKKDIKGSDYAACPIVAKDKSGYAYVLDTYLSQETSTERQITAIVDLLWRWSVPIIGIESNGFASLLPGLLREAISRKAQQEQTPSWSVKLVPIINLRNKVLRIRTLEPLIANSWLQFARGLLGEAIRQFAEFLPIDGAGKDDFPDAVEGAMRVVNGQYERRDIV